MINAIRLKQNLAGFNVHCILKLVTFGCVFPEKIPTCTFKTIDGLKIYWFCYNVFCFKHFKAIECLFIVGKF